jgi:sugar fermentation stimulation protein A
MRKGEKMQIIKKVRLARFIRRPNRFQAYVDIDDNEVMVHVPNTGRCREILKVGATVILREESNPSRKTAYDLIAGYKDNKLISIDSHIPNSVVQEALVNKKIRTLIGYDQIQREKTYGNSRFDFKLSNSNTGEEYYLEVKGVTLEVEGKAMFPDAPTERGRKHLLELVEVTKGGRGAGVLFLIQMKGVSFFTPYDEMDKAFGEALRIAQKNGVDIYAYDCKVTESSITLDNPIEVRL